MGVKVKLHWRGSGETKHRIYRLDGDRRQQMMTILAQRQMRRETNSQKDFEGNEGSPDQKFKNLDVTGDPFQNSNSALQQWLTPESLEDVKQMMKTADNIEAIEWIRQAIPLWVRQQINSSQENSLG